MWGWQDNVLHWWIGFCSSPLGNHKSSVKVRSPGSSSIKRVFSLYNHFHRHTNLELDHDWCNLGALSWVEYCWSGDWVSVFFPRWNLKRNDGGVGHSSCFVQVFQRERERWMDRVELFISTHVTALCKQDIYTSCPHFTVFTLSVCLCAYMCVSMLVCAHSDCPTQTTNNIQKNTMEPAVQAGMQRITSLNPLLFLCDPDGASGGRDCTRTWTVSVNNYVSGGWIWMNGEVNELRTGDKLLLCECRLEKINY